MNIALIAPPGGGKGTQAKLICDKFKITHISTGDIFRAILKGEYKSNIDTELIRNKIKNGELIADDIVVSIVFDRINKDDCKNGYLFDGFPRTINQAKIFDTEAKEKNLNKVIYIEVNEDSLIKRLTGRRTCPKCNRIYNIYYNPPRKENYCDVDNERLNLREDDNVETVKKRLEVFKVETLPLLDFYKSKGILYTIDGNKEVENIFKEIEGVLKG